MATNPDEIIDRLRDVHDLNLEDIETEADLVKELLKLKQKSGSKITEAHAELNNRKLVRISDRLFETEIVQENIVENVSGKIESAESFEDVKSIEITERKFPVRNTFERLKSVKSMEGRRKAFEGKIEERRNF